MGHYGGGGKMAAALVHHVFAIYKHGCCRLCYKFTDSYIEKGGQVKWEMFHFLWPVAWESEDNSYDAPKLALAL